MVYYIAQGEVSEWFKEPVLKTGDSARSHGFESHPLRQQKSPFVERQKGIFERCVPQAERDGVMCPSDVMCASRVKATLTEHITSLLRIKNITVSIANNITCP